MSNKHTKDILDRLYDNLQSQYDSADKDITNKNYASANTTLSKALGHLKLELDHAKVDKSLPAPELEQEIVSEEKLVAAYARISSIEADIRQLQEKSIKLHNDSQLTGEFEDATERAIEVDEKGKQAQQYEFSFMQLQKLSKQAEPFLDINAELKLFLKQVRECRANNSVSIDDLTKAMNATYDRLTGGSKEKFDSVVNKMNARHSVPLKLLGATLLLLGAALVAAAVFFSPVIVTAATATLATACLATAGVAVASTALSAGGTACFFKSTDRMKVAQDAKELGDHDLEEQHYAPLAP